MDFIVLRIIQNFMYRLTRPVTGNVPKRWFGVGDPYTLIPLQQSTWRLFLAATDDPHYEDWHRAGALAWRCSLGCARKRVVSRAVRDYGSCGGTIVYSADRVRGLKAPNDPIFINGLPFGINPPLGPLRSPRLIRQHIRIFPPPPMPPEVPDPLPFDVLSALLVRALRRPGKEARFLANRFVTGPRNLLHFSEAYHEAWVRHLQRLHHWSTLYAQFLPDHFPIGRAAAEILGNRLVSQRSALS
jgi:hypothetical protein